MPRDSFCLQWPLWSSWALVLAWTFPHHVPEQLPPPHPGSSAGSRWLFGPHWASPCHPRGRGSSALCQLARTAENARERGSATSQKRVIRSFLPTQFPPVESHGLVGTRRTQVLHKGLQKTPFHVELMCLHLLQPWGCCLDLLRLTWKCGP